MLHTCDNQKAQEDDTVELGYIDDANRLTVLFLTLVFDIDYSSLCLNDTMLHTHTHARTRTHARARAHAHTHTHTHTHVHVADIQ